MEVLLAAEVLLLTIFTFLISETETLLHSG